jgi:hypothetical protein
MSSYSEPFTKMATAIDHNADAPFAGAAVIIPPGQSQPIELFQMGSTTDEGQFWATILTSIQLRMKQIEDQQKVGRTFGMR